MTRRLACLALLGLLACDSNAASDPALTSASLDTQVRQLIGQWGVVPIGQQPAQNTNLVELGRSLFSTRS